MKINKKDIDIQAKQFLLNYGIRLKRKRKKARLTLIKLARLINSDISRISRIERGKINLTINEIYTLDAQMDAILTEK